MGLIIVPYTPLSVYLRSPFRCNIALKVIFPSKILGGIRYRHLSPSPHSNKRYRAQRYRNISIPVAGFFAFFYFDNWGDILMLVPTNCCDVNNQTSWDKHAGH